MAMKPSLLQKLKNAMYLTIGPEGPNNLVIARNPRSALAASNNYWSISKSGPDFKAKPYYGPYTPEEVRLMSQDKPLNAYDAEVMNTFYPNGGFSTNVKARPHNAWTPEDAHFRARLGGEDNDVYRP